MPREHAHRATGDHIVIGGLRNRIRTRSASAEIGAGRSRRAAVLTLAGFVGLGAVGSVLALHTYLQTLPPITPVPHSPTPTSAVGTTLYTYHSKNSGYSLAWSPDGQAIASGHGDATAVVWEAATGRRLYTYAGHSRTVEGVSWSPDGKRIASASDDGTVQLWDATTGSHVYIYKGHSSFVSRALWSPDGKRIASVGGDNTIQVWIAR